MLALNRPGRIRLLTGVAVVTALIAGGGLTASAAMPPVTKVDLVSDALADTVPPAIPNQHMFVSTRSASPDEGGIALPESSLLADRPVTKETDQPVRPTVPGPNAQHEPQEIEDKTAPAPPAATSQAHSDDNLTPSSMPTGKLVESAARVRLQDGTSIFAGPDLIYDGEVQVQSLTLGSGKVIETLASYETREDEVIAVAIVIKIDGSIAARSTVKTMSGRVAEVALPNVGAFSFWPKIRTMSEAEANHFATLR